MKCPLTAQDQGRECSNKACMYYAEPDTSSSGCAYSQIQSMTDTKDEVGIADAYGVSVSEVRTGAKLVKAGLVVSRFFEVITGREIEDGREKDFSTIETMEAKFTAWNTTQVTWEEAVIALKRIRSNL